MDTLYQKKAPAVRLALHLNFILLYWLGMRIHLCCQSMEGQEVCQFTNTKVITV